MEQNFFHLRTFIAFAALILLPAPSKLLGADAANGVFSIAGEYALEISPLMREMLPDDRQTPPANWQSRSGVAGELGHNGKPKQLDYHTTAVAFAHWAQLTGNSDWEKAARLIFEFEQKSKANAK